MRYALKLAFVQLEQERYDLIIPCIFYESDLLRPAFEVIGSAEFTSGVARLPGYDTTHTDRIVDAGGGWNENHCQGFR